ncbi:unnamed protein product [Amaranthus hypochondriacus]
MAAGNKSFAVMYSVMLILNLIGTIHCGNTKSDPKVDITQQVSNECILFPRGNCNVRLCTPLCQEKIKPHCSVDNLCCCS